MCAEITNKSRMILAKSQAIRFRRKDVSEHLDVLLDVASLSRRIFIVSVSGSRSELQLRDVHSLIATVKDLDWEYIRRWTASRGLRAC
jgi:hypothetical protein